jgi:TPP-dependent pyruvate/acetoin dehydrogenase alpha subunit
MTLGTTELLELYERMLTIRQSEARTVDLFKNGELQHGHWRAGSL